MTSMLRMILFSGLGIHLLLGFSYGQSEVLKETAAGQKILAAKFHTDWLIDPKPFQASVRKSGDGERVVIENGLVSREFVVTPNVATVSLKNGKGHQLIRAVHPEALITVNGQEIAVGGLVGQTNHAYLTKAWIKELKNQPNSMQLANFEIGQPKERFGWAQKRHFDQRVNWPPKGASIRFDFKMPSSDVNQVQPKEGRGEELNLAVSVHYELYDGVPTICKWLTVTNNGDQAVVIDRFKSEILGLVESESRVESRDGVPLPKPNMLHVETDFAFGGFNFDNANRHVVHFKTDPNYHTQVNYLRKTPCLLEVSPTYGPAQTIEPGQKFETYRTFEVAFDSTERERRGLTLRRNYRTIAPWVTENPIMHHLLSSDPVRVIEAIDEAAAVGFEMIILSFGSGFNMENEDPKYLAKWKQVAEYADTKGIEIGSYSLLSSRKIGGGNDIVSPPGITPTHGNCPALTSQWGQDYFRKLYAFFDKTGFDLLEHDGPYPGDVDVTPRPPLQKGEQDSRWVQWQIVKKFYEHCRATGVYLNAPDYYYLNGSSKCGMGYREVNWSLPRAQQVIHARQNIFDGTWWKTPSMGWMFVPLTQYHGGGAAATIEPLREHLEHYQLMMQCNFAFGVQACFRGPRLFDCEETQVVVKNNVDWFKKYREVLEADLIHGQRANGRDLDWMLHVNPSGQHRGMLVVFNPEPTEMKETIRVPLYYTGLTETATIKVNGLSQQSIKLARDYSADIEVSVPGNGMTWVLFEAP